MKLIEYAVLAFVEYDEDTLLEAHEADVAAAGTKLIALALPALIA